ncbi:shikimate kinase [Peptacetobacter hominis]|uniref:Shikimate kinase n=1 Tax=Peptacetobacter hominis TaxID=2743610 RepID=A0A544QV30_9FIRM|nr:shikimate kinase [Peptacetobacter hominis]TQQ84530.1 shikimate kinase [Peptacetobacter hominis]
MKNRFRCLKNKNIVLIGFMGSGKTTISDYLSKAMGRKKIDTDILIKKREKCSIIEIFENYGEEYFRNLESEVVSEISDMKNCIISCGGGTVLRHENVENLKKNGIIVLLSAKPKTVLIRVKNSDSRPILNGNMNEHFIKELMDKRSFSYMSVADIVVDTDNKSIISISDEIIDKAAIFASSEK